MWVDELVREAEHELSILAQYIDNIHHTPHCLTGIDWSSSRYKNV